MRFTFRIAWRYIFSKKSTNAINIISGITMLGIIIGSASLIIVLSAFNGFESLVLKLYGSFYSDITITSAEGKTFEASDNFIQSIYEYDGIEYISKTLEENALLAYNNQEHIATIKGVDTNYKYVTAVDDSVYVGDYILEIGQGEIVLEGAVMGSILAGMLDIGIGIDFPSVQIFMPKRGVIGSLNPRNAFVQKGIKTMGVFRIQQDFDSKYVIASLPTIQQLLNYDSTIVSSLELSCKKDTHIDRIQKSLQEKLGNGYEVKNRFMQNEFLYTVMRNERWVVYLILTFILIIATFNMIGSISMLVVDKKKDIAILRSLGATNSTIRNIFLIQGILQTLVSIFIGFTIATFLCLIQIKYGIISIPGAGNFVITAYPITLRLQDYFIIFFTILMIGTVASYFPASLAGKQKWMFKEE